jgi:hypothetical protein
LKINKGDLDWAVSQEILSVEQADKLWTGLSNRHKDQPRFTLVHTLYYFGALIIIGAMTWFMTSAWEIFGGGGIFLIASAYATGFIFLGAKLWSKGNLRIPAGLLIVIGVCMTPLIIYGLQRWVGLWAFDDPGEYRSFYKWIKGGWFTMEIATILAGLLALRFFKFPFITAPIAVALWFISMDLTPILFEGNDFSFQERKWVSLVFGLCMIIGSYFVDLKSKHDFAFWGYLFGCLAFWCGLSLMDSHNELSKFFYCLINIVLMGVSIFLHRKVFIIFGALGVYGYLYHISSTLFEDSLLFPFALTLQGVLILYLGITLNKHGNKIESLIPQGLQALRPEARH